jgi:hypothetical protein
VAHQSRPNCAMKGRFRSVLIYCLFQNLTTHPDATDKLNNDRRRQYGRTRVDVTGIAKIFSILPLPSSDSYRSFACDTARTGRSSSKPCKLEAIFRRHAYSSSVDPLDRLGQRLSARHFVTRTHAVYDAESPNREHAGPVIHFSAPSSSGSMPPCPTIAAIVPFGPERSPVTAARAGLHFRSLRRV